MWRKIITCLRLSVSMTNLIDRVEEKDRCNSESHHDEADGFLGKRLYKVIDHVFVLLGAFHIVGG